MNPPQLSEIARLREQIEREYEAAQGGLTQFAQCARHDFIEARMRNITVCHQRLRTIVGSEEADTIMVQAVWQGEI